MSEPVTAPDEGAEGTAASPWQERRTLLLGAGGAGVVVLALLVWFVLLSGGGEDEGGLVTSARRPAVDTPTASPTAARTQPARYDYALNENPFEPLLPPVRTATASTEEAAPTTPALDPLPGADGGQAPRTGGGRVPDPQVPVASSTARTRVTVVAIDADAFRARLRVDGKDVGFVRVGGTFGPKGSLVLSAVTEEEGGYATVYVGDEEESTAVDIRVGRSHAFVTPR